MLKNEEKTEILKTIFLKKKDLLLIRIKQSSGDLSSSKNIKSTKKHIAKLFTKINKK